MKLFHKISAFFRHFRTRFRISARDPRNDKEKWYIFLSPLNAVVALMALVVVFFVAVISVVVFTPVMDTLPGYPGNRSRNLLIEYNLKLDSLENQFLVWSSYYENLTRIMDGKAPVVTEFPTVDSSLLHRSDIPRIGADSALRSQLEGDGPYGLQQASAGRGNSYPEMFPPVKGVVKAKFDPRAGRIGTSIAVTENQPVMALMDGVVVNASWTPTEGNVIHILYPGNILSAYLHNASLTKKTGDRVYSGEVVAFTGNSTGAGENSGHTEIQLWINGTPVDPENYMFF